MGTMSWDGNIKSYSRTILLRKSTLWLNYACRRWLTLPDLAVHSFSQQTLHVDTASVDLPAITCTMRHVIHDWFQSLTAGRQFAAQPVCRLCRQK